MSKDFNFFKVDSERLKSVFADLKEILKGKREVILAIVFGGVLRRSVVRDIDLAVYLDSSLVGDEIDAAVYSEKLSKELSNRIGIPVDVVVINFAPMWLKKRILEGRVLIDRDPILRLSLKLAVMDNLVKRFHK